MTHDSFGGLLMRAIKFRQGFVRRLGKDARRAAQAQPQTFCQILRIEPPRTVKVVAWNADEGDD
jgi:hypothetical protein